MVSPAPLPLGRSILYTLVTATPCILSLIGLTMLFRRLYDPGVQALTSREFATWTFWIAFMSIPVHLAFGPLLLCWV